MKKYKALDIIYHITYDKRINRHLNIEHSLWDIIEDSTWVNFLTEATLYAGIREKTNLEYCIKKVIKK